MAVAAERRHSAVGAIIMLVVGIIALILVLHIIFVLIGTNPSNSIVMTVGTWAGHLAAWFKGMFTTSSDRWNAVLDYGLATIVYLVVGRLVTGVVERV
jgi:hypothetical protein